MKKLHDHFANFDKEHEKSEYYSSSLEYENFENTTLTVVQRGDKDKLVQLVEKGDLARL